MRVSGFPTWLPARAVVAGPVTTLSRMCVPATPATCSFMHLLAATSEALNSQTSLEKLDTFTYLFSNS